MRRTSKVKWTTAVRYFRKTQIMNIVGAFGCAIAGVALLSNKIQGEPFGILALVGGWSAVLVLVPAATARALSDAGSSALRRAMLRANWMLIGFWGLCLGISLALTALGHIPVADAVSTVLLSTSLGYGIQELGACSSGEKYLTAANFSAHIQHTHKACLIPSKTRQSRPYRGMQVRRTPSESCS
jgi:hypothetical protein